MNKNFWSWFIPNFSVIISIVVGDYYDNYWVSLPGIVLIWYTFVASLLIYSLFDSLPAATKKELTERHLNRPVPYLVDIILDISFSYYLVSHDHIPTGVVWFLHVIFYVKEMDYWPRRAKELKLPGY